MLGVFHGTLVPFMGTGAGALSGTLCLLAIFLLHCRELWRWITETFGQASAAPSESGHKWPFLLRSDVERGHEVADNLDRWLVAAKQMCEGNNEEDMDEGLEVFRELLERYGDWLGPLPPDSGSRALP